MLLPLSFKTLHKDFGPAASGKNTSEVLFPLPAAAALSLEAVFPHAAQPNAVSREGCTRRLAGSQLTGRRDRPHSPTPPQETSGAGNTLDTPIPACQPLPAAQVLELLLFWQIQGFFSLAVTSRASVSSSSSPSESRSDICCCSSGLMLFSARMSVRRAVG